MQIEKHIRIKVFKCSLWGKLANRFSSGVSSFQINIQKNNKYANKNKQIKPTNEDRVCV